MKKTPLIIFLILVVIIVIYIVLMPAKQNNVPSIISPVTTVSTSTAVYKNDAEGFSFSYPNQFSFADSQTLLDQPWEYNTSATGTLISRVLIPKSIQPQTNFSEAYFDVGVSTDTEAIKNCFVSPVGNEVDVSTSTINGVDFRTFHYSDAGAGNFYDVTSYHVLRIWQMFCFGINGAFIKHWQLFA